jgi:hypothetical protein
MSRSKHGKIDGQFVPVLATTLDSPAWKAMSHGAKVLFVNLKRKVPRESNRAYLSYRDACKALVSGRHKIREWFAELDHYGFIVLAVPGTLGVDGKGRAPHWRLTELGNTSRKSPEGLPEYPTRDFLQWDGATFDPKPFRYGRKWDYEKQNPGVHVDSTPVSTSTPPPVSTSTPPKPESGVHVRAIEGDLSGVRVNYISSKPLTGESAEPSSEEGESTVGHFDDEDERISSLKATEAKRRKEKAT